MRACTRHIAPAAGLNGAVPNGSWLFCSCYAAVVVGAPMFCWVTAAADNRHIHISFVSEGVLGAVLASRITVLYVHLHILCIYLQQSRFTHIYTCQFELANRIMYTHTYIDGSNFFECNKENLGEEHTFYQNRVIDYNVSLVFHYINKYRRSPFSM